jgi:hypothetical protein
VSESSCGSGAQVDPSLGTAGLHLRNAAGDDAPLGTTAIAGPYAQLVVAGTYDLTYAFVSGGSAGINVPLNQSAKLRSGIVVGTTPLALDVDISASMVSGTLSQSGVSYPGPWGSAIAKGQCLYRPVDRRRQDRLAASEALGEAEVLGLAIERRAGRCRPASRQSSTHIWLSGRHQGHPCSQG